MGVLEIIAGVLLILACIVVIVMVASQEGKGQGLSGVITGTEMMSNETRGRSKEVRQQRITKFAGIVFFVLTLAVNLFSLFAGK